MNTEVTPAQYLTHWLKLVRSTSLTSSTHVEVRSTFCVGIFSLVIYIVPAVISRQRIKSLTLLTHYLLHITDSVLLLIHECSMLASTIRYYNVLLIIVISSNGHGRWLLGVVPHGPVSAGAPSLRLWMFLLITTLKKNTYAVTKRGLFKISLCTKIFQPDFASIKNSARSAPPILKAG